MAKLISVNVGLPRDVSWEGRTVHTAIWKSPVQGRAMVRRLNIDGDGQGDLAGHGGEQRAVFVYQTASYRYWENELKRNDFTLGEFGENFTVDGLADDEVCIGDRYRIGSALFEVTQPRVTCFRVGLRTNEPRMPALLVAHHRPGFYFRVLQEGEVGAGDEIFKVVEGPQRLTVAETDALLYLPTHSPDQLQRALGIPALSPGWQESFKAILQQDEQGGATGNPGLAPVEPPPAWPGFRPMRVAQLNSESTSVLSIVLESADAKPLSPALPGQFVVLRVPAGADGQPVLRNYSLSDTPSADHYRISVKREERGVASGYIHSEASPRRCARRERASWSFHSARRRRSRRPAQRGSRSHAGPRHVACAGCGVLIAKRVVDVRSAQLRGPSLLSGITPAHSDFEAWPQLYPLQPRRPARSTRFRLRCSGPYRYRGNRATECAARRRLLPVWTVGVPAGSEGRSHCVGRQRRSCPRRNLWNGRGNHPRHNSRCFKTSYRPPGNPEADLEFRSLAAEWMSAGIPNIRACSNWPRPAMFRCDGRAAPASVTPARAH